MRLKGPEDVWAPPNDAYRVHSATRRHIKMNASWLIVPLARLTSVFSHCKLSMRFVPPFLIAILWSSSASSGVNGIPLKAHRYSCFSSDCLSSDAVALVKFALITPNSFRLFSPIFLAIAPNVLPTVAGEPFNSIRLATSDGDPVCM
jgi:hypothetical protein